MATIPALPREKPIDPKTGMFTIPWARYFYELFERVGGVTDPIEETDEVITAYFTPTSTIQASSDFIGDLTNNYAVVWSDANRSFQLQDVLTVVSTRRISGTTYNVVSSDYTIFADTDSNNITVNLEEGGEGRNLRIINCGSSGNKVTINPNGLEKLLGDNSNIELLDGDVIILTYNTIEGWW